MPGIIQSRMARAGPGSARNAFMASCPSCVTTALKPHFAIKLLISVRETRSSSAMIIGSCAKRATAARALSSVAFGSAGLPVSEICQGGENGIPFAFNMQCVPKKSTLRAHPSGNSYSPTIQADGFRLSYGGRKQGYPTPLAKILGPIGATVGSGFNDLVANSVAD